MQVTYFFYISGYNVPVHPAVKVIVMLKSKILFMLNFPHSLR